MVLVYFIFVRVPKLVEKMLLERGTFFQMVTEIAKKHNNIMIFEAKRGEMRGLGAQS